MTPVQLAQYDLFLDENDWDIYYWATQKEEDSAATTTEQGKNKEEVDVVVGREKPQGEWAQTIGAFKPAYRPVPQRWKNSEILSLLRGACEAEERGRGGRGQEGDGVYAGVGAVGGGGGSCCLIIGGKR